MVMPDMKHIVIVDDDEDLAKDIGRALDAEGFHVTTFYEPYDLLEHITQQGLPHLAIIDLNMPSMHGFDLSQQIKSRGDVPIIFVSGISSAATIIQGLNEYAEDYVVKPVDNDVLVARVKRILRRFPGCEYVSIPAFSVDNWLTIDLPSGQVKLNHEQHTRSLTPIEANLLYILLCNEGQVVPSNTLITRVWQFEDVGEETLRVHMYRLRHKIEPVPQQPRYIHTVRGVGYQFNLDGNPFGDDQLAEEFVTTVE